MIFLTFSGSAVFNGGNFSLSFCCLFGASWLLATPLTGELAISVVDLDLDLESRWNVQMACISLSIRYFLFR